MRHFRSQVVMTHTERIWTGPLGWGRYVIIGVCVARAGGCSSTERTKGSLELLDRDIESNPTRLRIGTGPDCMGNDRSRVVVTHTERIWTGPLGWGRYVIIGACVA